MLTIHKSGATPVPGAPSDRRLWLTSDRSRVVEDGDPDAAFLLATPGVVISSEDMARLGLAIVDGKVTLPAAATETEPEPPAAAEPETGPESESDSESEPEAATSEPDPAPKSKGKRRKR